MSDTKKKYLIDSYIYFNIDLYNEYFDKYSTSDFDVFNKNFQSNLNIEYYIVLFILLFSLKEFKR